MNLTKWLKGTDLASCKLTWLAGKSPFHVGNTWKYIFKMIHVSLNAPQSLNACSERSLPGSIFLPLISLDNEGQQTISPGSWTVTLRKYDMQTLYTIQMFVHIYLYIHIYKLCLYLLKKRVVPRNYQRSFNNGESPWKAVLVVSALSCGVLFPLAVATVRGEREAQWLGVFSGWDFAEGFPLL